VMVGNKTPFASLGGIISHQEKAANIRILEMLKHLKPSTWVAMARGKHQQRLDALKSLKLADDTTIMRMAREEEKIRRLSPELGGTIDRVAAGTAAGGVGGVGAVSIADAVRGAADRRRQSGDGASPATSLPGS
jgi:hypothetical protein